MLSPQLSCVLAVVSEIYNNYYYLLYIHNQMTYQKGMKFKFIFMDKLVY